MSRKPAACIQSTLPLAKRQANEFWINYQSYPETDLNKDVSYIPLEIMTSTAASEAATTDSVLTIGLDSAMFDGGLVI